MNGWSSVVTLATSIALVGCGGAAVKGTMSARATPFPVLVGPVGCVGAACPPEPAAVHAVPDLRANLGHFGSESTNYGSAGSSTITKRTFGGSEVFTFSVLAAMSAEPFDRKRVLRVESLHFAREEEEKSGNFQSSKSSVDATLHGGGRARYYHLAAGSAASRSRGAASEVVR
jgi:hypothetical protein